MNGKRDIYLFVTCFYACVDILVGYFTVLGWVGASIGSLGIRVGNPLTATKSGLEQSVGAKVGLPTEFTAIVTAGVRVPVVPPGVGFYFRAPVADTVIAPMAGPRVAPITGSSGVMQGGFFSSSSYVPVLQATATDSYIPTLPSIPIVGIAGAREVSTSRVGPSC